MSQLFLLRPTAKLFAFLRSCVISNTFATGFFTRCFSIWLCSFQSTFSGHHASRAGFRRGFFKSFAPSGSLSLTLRRSGFFRSLKTIQVQEEEQSFDQALLGFSFCLALSCSSQLSLRSTWNESSDFSSDSLPRKEVIQPHLPIRLPCYDFTPVIGLTFDGWLLSVTSPASGAPNSHGVTGGVYKARERIHRGMLIRDY